MGNHSRQRSIRQKPYNRRGEVSLPRAMEIVCARPLPARVFATQTTSCTDREIKRDEPNRCPFQTRRRNRRQFRPAEASRSAADFLPKHESLSVLRKAAETCDGCPLFRLAVPTVLRRGPGPVPTSVCKLREENRERIAGTPFAYRHWIGAGFIPEARFQCNDGERQVTIDKNVDGAVCVIPRQPLSAQPLGLEL
jgi:hypothetical protein